MEKGKTNLMPPILPPEFEAAMKLIVNTPKEAVDKAIEQEKKDKQDKPKKGEPKN